eukprot:4919133-Amphidinium_carterae.1
MLYLFPLLWVVSWVMIFTIHLLHAILQSGVLTGFASSPSLSCATEASFLSTSRPKLVIHGRTLSDVNMHRISNSPKHVIRGRTCIMAERCQQATLNANTAADRVHRNHPNMFVCHDQNNTNSPSEVPLGPHGFVKSPRSV